MKKRALPSVLVPTLFGLFVALAPTVSLSNQESTGVSLRTQKALDTQKTLEGKAQSLLERLVDERAKALEQTRENVRETMEKWEEDPEYLNGKGLAAALYNAESVAEEYGFDVEKLHKMYAASKKLILGLEMTGKCGEGSPHLADMENAIDGVSETASGALAFFGLVSNEEERLACVQTEKLKLYREVNRAYIYALTEKSARDSAAGFRRYAGQLLTISGSDAAFLADQAKKMAETQDTIVTIFEMAPVIGEMLDLYKLGTGTNAMGEKASDFDMALTAVFLFTPEIASQAFKRYPGMFSNVKGFLTELVYPADGFFDALIHNANMNLDVVKKRAGQILEDLLDIESEIAKKVTIKVHKVTRESVEAIGRRMAKMPGYNHSRQAAIAASNMVPAHAKAIRKVAMDRAEILMFRNFSAQGRVAMEAAMKEAIENGNRLVTKWIDIKPKSASNALLGAGIPVNPGLSKYEDALRLARKVGDKAEIAKILGEIAEKKKQVTKLFASVDEKGRKLVDKIPATYRYKDSNHKVLWVPDANGNPVIGIRNADGKLFDPIKKKVFDVDASKAKEVLIFTDPKGTKILPDYDMFAIGAKANPNDVRSLTKAGEKVEAPASVFAGKKGGLSEANDQSINAINTKIVQETHVSGNLVHHGPANFWKDKPDYPITVFMPDGSVKNIIKGPASNPDQWIKEFFHGLKQQGYKGFDPHPDWGWPAYNPRHGYLSAEEAAALAKAGKR